MGTRFWGMLAAVIVSVLAFPLVVNIVKGKEATAQSGAQVVRPNTQSSSSPARLPAAPSPPSVSPTPPPQANPAAFQRLQNGMTYAQCIQIIGVEGKSRGTDRGGMAVVRWDMEDGSYYELMFARGRLAGRGFGRDKPQQVPIDPVRARQLEKEAMAAGKPVVLTVAEYERLQAGMTYAQCVAIAGPGGEPFRFGASGGQAQTNGREAYVWQNPGYTGWLTFAKGRLVEKVWYGKPG